jgi:hypothetical protein
MMSRGPQITRRAIYRTHLRGVVTWLSAIRKTSTFLLRIVCTDKIISSQLPNTPGWIVLIAIAREVGHSEQCTNASKQILIL